jgi:hypothetical protein
MKRIQPECFVECPPDKHKPRDNKLGVTWCVKCGRLFTRPCGKDLKETDKLIVNAKEKK